MIYSQEVIENTSKALKVCGDNKELFRSIGISDFSKVYDGVRKLDYAIKLQNEYNIVCVTSNMVQTIGENVFVRINDNMWIASMGEKYRRTISFPVDGRQPEDETLLVIGFSTGAYMFGQDYPKELFERMWEEIKTYDFKYVDDMNHNIYFSLDNAAPIANGLSEILDKYYKIYREESDIRRAEKLRQELAKIEEKLN